MIQNLPSDWAVPYSIGWKENLRVLSGSFKGAFNLAPLLF